MVTDERHSLQQLQFQNNTANMAAAVGCWPHSRRDNSQPATDPPSRALPAKQITELGPLTSEIDFLRRLSQCPRWRLGADSANPARAGRREQNRLLGAAAADGRCGGPPPGRGVPGAAPPAGRPPHHGSPTAGPGAGPGTLRGQRWEMSPFKVVCFQTSIIYYIGNFPSRFSGCSADQMEDWHTITLPGRTLLLLWQMLRLLVIPNQGPIRGHILPNLTAS